MEHAQIEFSRFQGYMRFLLPSSLEQGLLFSCVFVASVSRPEGLFLSVFWLQFAGHVKEQVLVVNDLQLSDVGLGLEMGRRSLGVDGQLRAPVSSDDPHHLRHFVHLLEVDQFTVKRLAALVEEGQIFEQQRSERNQRRFEAREQVSVGLVVP